MDLAGNLEIHLDFGENHYDPRQFVEGVSYADELGFGTAWLGDHFMPWFHSGERSSFVWSVLSSALENSEHIRVGPLVTTPIGARYHPAIVAQASATLDNMYPGRFLLGIGTGEALNEVPFWNDRWPVWKERIERLTEGVGLIRKLWLSKKPFSFNGKYFGSRFYYLYTKPRSTIPIYFSAVGKKAAYHAGLCADYLITMSPRNDNERIKQEILPSFEKGSIDAGRAVGPLVVYASFSFQRPEEFVRDSWRSLGWVLKNSWSMTTPVEAEKAGRRVTSEDIRRNYNLCKSWRDVVKVVDGYVALGARAVIFYAEPKKSVLRAIAKNLLSVF